VTLSLNGETISNDGYVRVIDIGTGDTGLHCNNDRSGSVAELWMVQLRESGTSLMGLKLVLMDRSLLVIPLKTSSPEIGLLE
jgi:hypothetical protein